MKGLSAQGRSQRILRQFYRSGNEGQWTRAFEDLPESVRSNLLRLAVVRDEELPVLSYFRDPEHWVLLTTEQVITWRPEGILRLPWSEIEDATVEAAYTNRALAPTPQGKLRLDRLEVGLTGGRVVGLELEAGAPFFGFWNVLKMIAVLRKE